MKLIAFLLLLIKLICSSEKFDSVCEELYYSTPDENNLIHKIEENMHEIKNEK